MGRRLSFEPQFRFALQANHGPWCSGGGIMRFGRTNSDWTLHTNYSFSYKTITITTPGEPQELIRTTRYLVGAVAPNII